MIWEKWKENKVHLKFYRNVSKAEKRVSIKLL